MTRIADALLTVTMSLHLMDYVEILVHEKNEGSKIAYAENVMNDWNENGKLDTADRYIDCKLSVGEKYTGSGRKKNGGFRCGVLIYMFFVIIELG